MTETAAVTREAGRISALIPRDQDFGGLEYAEYKSLSSLADELTYRYPGQIADLSNLRVRYYWRRKSAATLGKCFTTSGLLREALGADVVIWLAANLARDAGFEQRQVEALLFHELLHIQLDDKTGKYALRGHDFEGFMAELEKFGPWRADLISMVKAAGQLSMELLP